MTRVYLYILLTAGLFQSHALVLAKPPVDPTDPPQGRFTDDWAEVYMGGSKAGYAHSTLTRQGDLIETKSIVRLRIERAGQTIELGVEQGTTETLLGEPRSFHSIMDLSAMKFTTRGTVRDGKVSIVNMQYGMEQKQEFPFEGGALMTWGTYREGFLKGFTQGTEYTLPVFAPELRLDGPVKLHTKIGEWESFEHQGQSKRGQRVTAVMEGPIGSIETVSWIDESGTPIRVKMPMPGVGEMEIITADQETALKDFVPAEVFMTTTLKSDKPIDPARVKRIRFRLSSENKDAQLSNLPTTYMQQVVRHDDTSVELLVTRKQDVPSSSQNQQAQSLSNRSDYLESNLMMNLEDPELTKLATRAAGDETDPARLAQRLTEFVTDYVSNKSMSIGFASANEVARTKEGDCSEHGILLAALGRIKGLPSRVVVGLAYAPFFGGESDIFGYHLWTQFGVHGAWVDYDAALTHCSPARIALSTSSLKDTGLADLSLALLNRIGSVKLEVLEIE